MPEAHPLTWPAAWPRVPANRRRESRFALKLTLAHARDELIEELRRLGARHVTISTNIALRQDGLPYSNRRPPEDPAAAVYFTLHDKPLVLACDKWNTVQDNLWAIRKHVEALRGQNRWGVGSVAQAFSGYRLLPDSANSTRPWPDVLGVPRDASPDIIRAAFRRLAFERHPDRGGSSSAMADLNRALDDARKERSFQ